MFGACGLVINIILKYIDEDSWIVFVFIFYFSLNKNINK